VRVLAAFEPQQDVPIYAVTASARQRLPKIRACIDYWADHIGAITAPRDAVPPPRAARSRATR
jgi:hypothetical protein